MVAKPELGASCFGVAVPKREKGVAEVVVVVMSGARVGVVVVDVVAIMPVVVEVES